MLYKHKLYTSLSVADAEPIIWQFFSRRMHKKIKEIGPRGGRLSGAPPLDATPIDYFYMTVLTK